MRICDLKQKEVINIIDCQRIGYVCDLIFDLETGVILSLIVPGPCKVFGFIGRESEYIIDLCYVRQVGDDVILVEINLEDCLVKTV